MGSVGVLAQSFLAEGWYDEYLDPADTTADTAAEIDDTFSESKNYLLFGGLLAVAANAYAIAMPLISGQPEAPEE